METIKKPTNFRDLGGFKTESGKQIIYKRLLRSGELSELPDEIKSILKLKFDLDRVIDFRTAEEIAKSPDDLPEGVQYSHVDLLDNSFGKTGSLHDLESNIKPELVDQMMKDVYKRLISDQHARQGYRNFLQSLLDQQQGSVLFHCFAGKDRTGVAAAIILELLGVSREDIYEDYLKTNDMRAEENRQIIEAARRQGAAEDALKAFQAALLVKKEYLEFAFDTAEQEFGSFRNYICNGIGLSEKEINRLRQLYLM